jgi:DMSO/TMAO reductase YedYZ molybdopterin-dependent catalytic subunit
LTKGQETRGLTLDELKALPSTGGQSWYVNSANQVMGPFDLKGVPLDSLFAIVGGIAQSEAAVFRARDGYTLTISYDQFTGSQFGTYDVTTAEELPHGPLRVFLAYEQGGKPIDEAFAGPLRLAVLAGPGQATGGDIWVKWIERIEIVPLDRPWSVKLEGKVTEDLPSSTFDAGVRIGGHLAAWTDERGRVWEGLPLWFLVARVDDETEQNRQAFNDALADKGYAVEVVSDSGAKQVFSSAEVKRNNNIIVAYRCDGQPVTGRYWPLRLVGSGVPLQRQIGPIAAVRLIFP